MLPTFIRMNLLISQAYTFKLFANHIFWKLYGRSCWLTTVLKSTIMIVLVIMNAYSFDVELAENYNKKKQN